MKKSLLTYKIPLIITCIISLQACQTFTFRNNYNQANTLLHDTNKIRTKPFLKAHLKNGDVCVLENPWKVDTILNLVSGKGTRYDFNRKNKFEGEIKVPVDSVAIFETNKKLENTESGRIGALTILTGIDVAMAIYCVVNPKACFGSCPTFYVNKHDSFHYADAEGFSNAIVPAMEYADIDALNNKPVAGGFFGLTMKNEALETHCVNDVKLLAYPRNKGERVYQSPGNNFYLCENNYPVTMAKAAEGNITELVKTDDRLERFSLSDEKNLNSKEEVFLTFENVKDPEELGLLVNFRQTLMTTYLFYSAMGYMGDKVSDLFTRVEREKKIRDNFDSTTKELGNITLYLWNEKLKKWELQDHLYETGPIAINKQILPLKNQNKSTTVKLKLVINKGLWRLDYLALTNIKTKVQPISLDPVRIVNKGQTDEAAMVAIKDPEKHLISLPGNEYHFNFMLPEQNQDYELFLYSKGYYLEWMRENWLKDKNLVKLKTMVNHPKIYLKGEAKAFKKYESTMEQVFWNSKIDTETF